MFVLNISFRNDMQNCPKRRCHPISCSGDDNNYYNDNFVSKVKCMYNSVRNPPPHFWR